MESLAVEAWTPIVRVSWQVLPSQQHATKSKRAMDVKSIDSAGSGSQSLHIHRFVHLGFVLESQIVLNTGNGLSDRCQTDTYLNM